MITKFNERRKIARTLPTAYDDTLSYLEVVDKLIYKVNEVIESIDEIQSEWESEKADIERVKTSVSKLESDFDNFKSEMQSEFNNFSDKVRADVQTQFDELTESVNTKISNFENEVNTNFDNLTNNVNSSLTSIRSDILAFKNTITSYVDNKIEVVETKHSRDIQLVNEKIDNLEFEYPPILNMITGRYDTIQNVLEMLYSMVRTDALTCTEFDALVITCNDFDDLEMSASEFDTNSKNIIGG